MWAFRSWSIDEPEQPEPLRKPHKRKSPPNFELRKPKKLEITGYHSDKQEGRKTEHTHEVWHRKGANSTESTVRVPDVVETRKIRGRSEPHAKRAVWS